MQNAPIGFRRRLELFGIDDKTKAALLPFLQPLRRELETILHEFFRTARDVPVLEQAFAGIDQFRLIKKLQVHWLSVFACDWDEAYVRRAIGIGDEHARSGTQPAFVVSGYAALRQSFLRCALRAFDGGGDLPEMLCAIDKVVTLDQDIVMASQMHGLWKQRGGRAAERDPEERPSATPEAGDPDVGDQTADDNVVYV